MKPRAIDAALAALWRPFEDGRAWLWTLLLIYTLLQGGALLGIEWQLRPGVAFGRLLEYQAVAASEALLAIAILATMHFARSQRALIGTLALGASSIAVFHQLNFFIGTEFLLLWGALRLAGMTARRA